MTTPAAYEPASRARHPPNVRIIQNVIRTDTISRPHLHADSCLMLPATDRHIDIRPLTINSVQGDPTQSA